MGRSYHLSWHSTKTKGRFADRPFDALWGQAVRTAKLTE
jgi:hypothetical protein